MKKLYGGIAGVMALALVGVANAEDPRNNETRQDQPLQRDDQSRVDNPQQRNNSVRQENAEPDVIRPARPDPVARPDTSAAGTSAEYLAELKRCDPLSGNEKTACLEQVMKKYGQM
jgi:hypothetical protein